MKSAKSSRLRILGTTVTVPIYKSYYKDSNLQPHKIGVMVEYVPSESSGRVYTLSAVTAFYGVRLNDQSSTAVIKNLIDYAVSAKFDDMEVEGCPWNNVN